MPRRFGGSKLDRIRNASSCALAWCSSSQAAMPARFSMPKTFCRVGTSASACSSRLGLTLARMSWSVAICPVSGFA